MYESKILEKGISATETNTVERHHELGESNLGLGIIMTVVAFIGAWGFTCLFSGLSHAASIREMGSTLITALIGI